MWCGGTSEGRETIRRETKMMIYLFLFIFIYLFILSRGVTGNLIYIFTQSWRCF